jgi:hypothetical protein
MGVNILTGSLVVYHNSKYDIKKIENLTFIQELCFRSMPRVSDILALTGVKSDYAFASCLQHFKKIIRGLFSW